MEQGQLNWVANFIWGIADDVLRSGTYLLYDGTDGMLTVAEETLQQLAAEHGKQVATHLYGHEIQCEGGSPLHASFVAV